MSQGKSKTMPMQFFGGVEAVYYGIVQVVNLTEKRTILRHLHISSYGSWISCIVNRVYLSLVGVGRNKASLKRRNLLW